MTRSPERCELLDFDRDVPTSAGDVAALRRIRQQPVSLDQVMSAVRAAGPRSAEELRARGTSRGLPFEL